MSLVCKQFDLVAGTPALECYIFIATKLDDSQEFWFKGRDIAKYLGYKNTCRTIRNMVPSKWQCTWSELIAGRNSAPFHSIFSNWQSNTVFISEPGLYSLVTHSNKPEAIRFSEWIYEEILPSLRATGQYSVIKKEKEALQNQLILANTSLIEFGRQMIIAREDAEKARRDAFALLHPLVDSIAKPRSSELLHTLMLHQINDTGEVVFTRCQRRSLPKALKRLQDRNPRAQELYRNGYVPNGINVLNCVKDILKDSNILYEAKFNNIKLIDKTNADDYLVEMVQRILRANRE